jgi:hypothetical protein
VTTGLLHGLILLDDPGPRLPGEARSDVQRDVVVTGELDRPQVEDATAGGGDLEHLLDS